jgi:antitoxin HicB
MTNEITRDLEYYRNLPYGIALRKDEDGDWIARVEELSGCIAHGETPARAVENLEEVKVAWIEDAIEAGDAIPEPRGDEKLPSGKWLQRVPRSLHKGLTEMAENEGVSLNQLVSTILAESLGRRRATPIVAVGKPIEIKGWENVLQAKWHQHQKEWDIGGWQIDAHKPTEFAIDALGSRLFGIPNQINETDFRVTERASKKDFAFKA